MFNFALQKNFVCIFLRIKANVNFFKRGVISNISETGMINVLSGILLVIILTLIFTIVLVGGTAVWLLSSARAIVHKRSIGNVYSKANAKKMARLKPIAHTYAAILISIRDVSINRYLTTFKMPGEIKLFNDSLYFKPYFSGRAYLINTSDITNVSVNGRKVNLEFSREDRKISVQYRVRNALLWVEAIQKLKS